MSQDVSTKSTASEPLTETMPIAAKVSLMEAPTAESRDRPFANTEVATPPWAVETYADRLIDDIFQDLDHSLRSGSTLPNEPAQPKVVALRPIKIPQIVLPSAVMPGSQSLDGAELSTIGGRSANGKQRKTGKSFDRLLLGAACTSLAIMLGLWLASREEVRKLWSPTPPAEPLKAAEPPPAPTFEELKAEADAEFVEYMQRSLDLVEQKAAMGVQTAIAPTNFSPLPPPLPTLPPMMTGQVFPNTPPTMGNLAEALNRVAVALEKLEKIYPELAQQSPAPIRVTIAPPPSSSPSPRPSPGSSSVAKAEAPETPSVASSSVAKAEAPDSTESADSSSVAKAEAPDAAGAAPAPTQSAPQQVAQAPAEPEPVPLQQAAEIPAEPTEQSAAQPQAVHTLRGILELGDRSAALFEINGVARRVHVGENIGGSSWTLVEVANQAAVIRRNGEVRSLYVGQSF